MSQYFFRIQYGQFAGESGVELADDEAAFAELRKVCADMVGSIARNIDQNAEWRMELLDECKKPVFRISLVSEALV